MIYIDKDLCTGCAICLAACNRGALSVNGNAVVIDEALCTSCGRCLEVCLTGAIISMEVVPQPPSLALAQIPEAQPFWAGASTLPSNLRATATAPVPQPAAVSKLALLEKGLNVLNGVFAIAGYVLDRKHGRSSWLTVVTDRAKDATASTATGRGMCPGGRQGRRTRQGQGLGRGLGGGRSLGGLGGRGDRRRINRRNRAT